MFSVLVCCRSMEYRYIRYYTATITFRGESSQGAVGCLATGEVLTENLQK